MDIEQKLNYRIDTIEEYVVFDWEGKHIRVSIPGDILNCCAKCIFDLHGALGGEC